jgi:3-dehydroquinate synthase
LVENEADRKTLLINLGGGVVTDMGGFVASVFKRGIPFINIPTTLLGLTDASIGSKTGIDLSLAKNQIGTFAHPQAVFISTDFLRNLPERELISGMGEVLKYAFIDNNKIWDTIKYQELSADIDFDIFVNECVHIKNKIVEQDFYEQGIRKVLNFGHTFGHAIESYSLINEKRNLLHGEAVALGMIVELYLSVQFAGFDKEKQIEIQQYILDNFALYPIEESDFEALIDLMRKDKKNSESNIAFVLLQEIGSPIYDQIISEEDIIKALQYYADL